MPRSSIRGNPGSKEFQTVQNQPHKWKTSLCSCCEKPGGYNLCCKALCCPCCVYADNVSRLAPKEAMCGGSYYAPCCGKYQPQFIAQLCSFDVPLSFSICLPCVGALSSTRCLLRSTNKGGHSKTIPTTTRPLSRLRRFFNGMLLPLLHTDPGEPLVYSIGIPQFDSTHCELLRLLLRRRSTTKSP
jgi:hypothetical protein